jgi:hypothetical protein
MEGWTLVLVDDHYEWVVADPDKWGKQPYMAYDYDGNNLGSGTYNFMTMLEMILLIIAAAFIIWLASYTTWTIYRRRNQIYGEGWVVRAKDWIELNWLNK